MGGLVIAASGHNPIDTYLGILDGAGLNWFWDDFGNTDVFDLTTFNFTQTLLRTTTFIFTGLAVAFAFRCGLFNIGGQGQYTIGIVVAVWVGAYWGNSLPNGLHVVVGVVLAALAGAIWAGIAGILKATVGAHEVITTIMLNWIAIWFASYCFGQGGPLQNTTPGQESVPISDDVYEKSGAIIPILWGDQGLQALHYGFFLAIAALIVFSIVLNRTTLGYEVRAVGFNPEAAALRRDQREEELLPGDGDLGVVRRPRRRGPTSSAGSTTPAPSTSRRRLSGFVGIAVALLGRLPLSGSARRAHLRRARLRHHARPRPRGVRPDAWPGI